MSSKLIRVSIEISEENEYSPTTTHQSSMVIHTPVAFKAATAALLANARAQMEEDQHSPDCQWLHER